ncbi:MAG: hypothetical protein JW702_05980 [Clostridiales bacterium]|nr:hypothetical protein [Clostridiales bacterium]
MSLWLIVIGVVVYLYVSNGNTKSIVHRNESEALEQLKLKYVNNEIDDETFIKMKSVLYK